MEFIETCKILFSSLSARICRYLYLNVPNYEDYLILSNAPPDVIAEYEPSQCTIYIVSVHPVFLVILRSILNIVDLETTCVFKTSFVLSILTKNKPESFQFKYDLNTGLIKCFTYPDDEPILIKEPKEVTDEESDSLITDDDKINTDIFTLPILKDDSVAGTILNIPYVLLCLSDTLKSIEDKLESVLSDDVPSTEIKYVTSPDIKYLHANWYKLPYPIKDTNKHQAILLVDGLDSPSIKELIRKFYLKKPLFKDTSFKQYLFYISSDVVQAISLTLMDDIEVITMRPFNKTIILPQ